MSNFWTIYKFELKKILKRKVLIVTCFVLWLTLTAVGIGSIFIENYSDTNGNRINAYQYTMLYRDNAKSYSGRPLDASLLHEYNVGFADTLTNRYLPLYYSINGIMELNNKNSGIKVTEEMLYSKRRENQEKAYAEAGLTEEEISYWRERETEVSTPIVFEYFSGWGEVLANITFMKVVALLLITVLLANIFSGERLRKTDQLILSSPLRQNEMYYSKMLTCVTIGGAIALICLVLSSIPTLTIWGFDGLNAQVQLLLPNSSINMTIGGLIGFVCIILIAALSYYSVFIGFLSELIDNSMSVVGVSFALIILSLFFRMPENYGVLAQIYNYFPTRLFSNFNDVHVFSFFGYHLNFFEFLPFYYLVNSFFLLAIGRVAYSKWVYR